MAESRTKFYLDCENAKWKGVCAGAADYMGIDALWVRLALVALTLGLQQWWLLIAYFVVAWVAGPKPTDLYPTHDDAKFWQGVRTNPKRSTAEVRAQFRELDRRLADIETHFTSQNRALASEIDALR